MFFFKEKVSPEKLGFIIFSQIAMTVKEFVEDKNTYQDFSIKYEDKNNVFIEAFIAFVFATLQIVESMKENENIKDRIVSSVFSHLYSAISQTFEFNKDELESFKEHVYDRIKNYKEVYIESLSHNIPLMKLGRIMISNIAGEEIVDATQSTLIMDWYTSIFRTLPSVTKKYKIVA